MQTETAVRVLTGVMRQKGAPPAARVLAANSLLDRGWGKAPQQLESESNHNITVTIRQIIESIDQSSPADAMVIEHESDPIQANGRIPVSDE